MFLISDDQRARLGFVLWAATAAFMTYATMYAFRKPLSAAVFEGKEFLGISYKVVVVITQVLGYLTAKLLGIKVISELSKSGRRRLLLGLIACSELALLLFAITPHPYGFIWVFFNGLPLGLIWGIVFSYIEGRQFTDVLATFLSISFIVSSGVVKTTGRVLVENYQVSEFWMPFAVGLLFLPLMLLASWMLQAIPEPNEEDKRLRTERKPMNRQQRRKLFAAYTIGLTAILIANLLMTIGRDIKDNFLVEIWQSLEVQLTPYVYSRIETQVGVIVLVALALLVFVKNNRRAFSLIHLVMGGGLLLVLLSTRSFQQHQLTAEWWMVLHGVGLYMAYIAFQSLYFERFIATFHIQGNVGFLIYLSDFIGYLGSCMVLIGKELIGVTANWQVFFIQLTYVVALAGILATVVAQIYFSRKSGSQLVQAR